MLSEGEGCFTSHDENGKRIKPLPDFMNSVSALKNAMQPFLTTLSDDGPHMETLKEIQETIPELERDVDKFQKSISEQQDAWKDQKKNNGELKKAVDRLEPLAEASRDLVKQVDLVFKLATRLIETCEKDCNAKDSDAWSNREITRARKNADETRQSAVEQLKQVRYYWKQAHWLTVRFPEAELCDVEGLVKLVDKAEIESNDWSLTPGRYVGVAPEEEDEDFDFEETLREIHVELEDLNNDAVKLAATIKKNFEELGI
jgi:type I restriction enzyme M protein